MSINSDLNISEFNLDYLKPKSLIGDVRFKNAASAGEELVLSCCKKTEFDRRDDESEIIFTVLKVEGVEEEASDILLADIASEIKIFSPYNKYHFLIEKKESTLSGETGELGEDQTEFTYDISIRVDNQDGYLISKTNSLGEKRFDLLYNDVESSKAIVFGSIVLEDGIIECFDESIEFAFEYDIEEEVEMFEFYSAVIENNDDEHTISIKPDTINVGGETKYVDSVLELDNILGFYEQTHLQDVFYLFANLRVEEGETGETGEDSLVHGAMIGIETEIVYFNKQLKISRDTNNIYIAGSAGLHDADIELSYTTANNDKIIDFDEFKIDRFEIRFVEDGPYYEDIEVNYTYDDENNYTLKLPYGIPPPSNPEGWEIAQSNNLDINGEYFLTDELSLDFPVYKHKTNNCSIKVYSSQYSGGKRIGIFNGNNIVHESENNFSESVGMNLSAYTFRIHDMYGETRFLGTYYIDAVKEEGKKTLSIILYDKYGNHTNDTTPFLLTLSISPESFTKMYIKLLGSSGSNNYTGFYNKFGRLFPTDYITVMYYAECNLPFRCRFLGDVVDNHTYYEFDEDGINSRVIRLNVANMNDSILDKDSRLNVTIEFQDDAKNTRTISESIHYISKLHRFENQRLRSDSEGYQTEINRMDGNMINRIAKRRVSLSEHTRSWNDIFWPSNHGYPTNDDGEVDVTEALRISRDVIDETGKTGPRSSELLSYDKLSILSDGSNPNNDALEYDNEGRVNTIWNANKKYGNMVNAYGSADGEGLVYFIIDNGGHSDFRLEFEHFDFDSSITKLPRNPMSPYDGDVLVVYDASDPDAVEEVLDNLGRVSYVLRDSTKLREIYAFTGSGFRGDIAMKTFGAENIELVGNGFITPNIDTTSRICLIPYTDNANSGSGFKLRAGVKHNVEYVNYDFLNDLGEIWVHESPELKNGAWRGSEVVNASGQYYTSSSTIDYEKGLVFFSDRPKSLVTANLTHYDYLYTDGSNAVPKEYFTASELKQFLTYHDDLLDYTNPSIAVVPSGVVADHNLLYDYFDVALNKGKVVGGYTINKDTGLIEFSGSVPSGRLLSNYYYHTYYRLTNDGYGDLYFYDPSLVPDSSVLSYTDWTYVDLKLVNEGGNTLTNGVLKFLTRGYVSSGGTVDRVLNNNRPWDVQIGTDVETVNRTGAVSSFQKSTFATPSRSVAISAASSQSVGFGTLMPKQTVYVRVYWCLASNAQGTSYVETTRGRKLYSAELSGRYYTLTV